MFSIGGYLLLILIKLKHTIHAHAPYTPTVDRGLSGVTMGMGLTCGGLALNGNYLPPSVESFGSSARNAERDEGERNATSGLTNILATEVRGAERMAAATAKKNS